MRIQYVNKKLKRNSSNGKKTYAKRNGNKEEKQEKEKGNFWLTVASFIVNKRKAIEILFVLAMIYSVLSINKVQVNQDITSYLPADSETRIGLSLMEEQFTTYGSAKVMVSNITYAQAEDLVDDLENIEGVKQIEFDDSKDHFTGADALFSVTFDGTEDEQISKDALEEVKETLDGYDVYVSSSVGEEERSAESLSQDMNIILVLAVVIIVAVLMLSTKAYLQIPVLLITFGVAAVLNMGKLLVWNDLICHKFHCRCASAGTGNRLCHYFV